MFVETALVAGAAAASKELVQEEIKTSYLELKASVIQLLGRYGRKTVEEVEGTIAEASESPGEIQAALQALPDEALEQLSGLANELDKRINAAGGRFAAVYKLQKAQGVQIGGEGSTNTQHNSFR